MSYKIAIFGGDARYIEVIHQLKILKDTELLLIGFDELEFNATNIKQTTYQEIQPEALDAVILPVQGIGIEGIVDAAFSDSKIRSEEHTSELQSRFDLVCRLLLEKKK